MYLNSEKEMTPLRSMSCSSMMVSRSCCVISWPIFCMAVMMLSFVITPELSVSNWLNRAYSMLSSKNRFTSRVATRNSV